MECRSNSSDGSSSLDLSLKRMSSNIIDSAKLSLAQLKLPKIYDVHDEELLSPCIIDDNLKLIDLKYEEDWPDLCITCYICML